jgi:hypothetical protein
MPNEAVLVLCKFAPYNLVVADEIKDIKFLCLSGTIFDQETRVCERVDEVDCSQSTKFYDLNLELFGRNGLILYVSVSFGLSRPFKPKKKKPKKKNKNTKKKLKIWELKGVC